MVDSQEFRGLINRVRAGDEAAATELVRRYEAAIRRAARIAMLDRRLSRVLDSADIAQSVMASFFVRAALGQYTLETPDQLLRLLSRMARNKLANQSARLRAARHDPGHLADAVDIQGVPAPGACPARQAEARELLEETRRRLPPETLEILERRQRGDDWATIASDLGGQPEALRKKYARAVDRVARQLGL
jgi:DNA-directed RNA polymerase specialized sigma24 family protein